MNRPLHDGGFAMSTAIPPPATGTLAAEAEVALAPRSETVADEPLYEVVDGRIVEKSMGAFQVWVAARLLRWLFGSDAVTRLGEVIHEMLFTIDPDRNLKRRPDVAFVSYDRWPQGRAVPNEEAWNVVPDLAVEVISPSNAADEVVKKVGDYFRAGVRLVWVIYPIERLVYVYRSATDVHILQVGDDLDGGDVLPGFRRPVQDLFEEAAAPAAG
jgi:Uma2 family endonuclease